MNNTLASLFFGAVLAGSGLAACGGGGSGTAAPAPPAPPPVADPFVFQTASKVAYQRFDRMGQPVVATVLLLTKDKDQFNGTDPGQDGDYASLMTQRLEQLHVGLDDAIIAKGLAVCPTDVCLRQVIGKIIPDTLQFDLSQPDGFPNGRRFEDPTVDRILSMALLDLTTPGTCGSGPCTVFSFEQLPNNPTRNESPFLAQFPYLAAAHPPP